MDRLLHVMTGFSILLIGLVLLSVRRAHIRVEYSVSWLVAALALLALAQWRGLLDRIAEGNGTGQRRGRLAGGYGRCVPSRVVSIVDDDLQPEGFEHCARAAPGDPRISSLESHEEAKTAGN